MVALESFWMKLKNLLLILLFLPSVGTLGFMFIEGWRPLDALYMSFITLSTVGYEVVGPLSDGGKVFVIFYLAAGLAVFLFSIVKLGEMAVLGELKQKMEERKMHRDLKSLKDHFIVCGAGKMGRSVSERLEESGKEFIVIESDERKIDYLKKRGWLYLQGDATKDDILQKAGIDKSVCLASVLSSDADNLYIVMSAKLLNSRAAIVARAKEEDATQKLKKAGADFVVNPYMAGADKMTLLMTGPD